MITKYQDPLGPEFNARIILNSYFKLFHGAARRGGYFYSISIVFLTSYMVLGTLYLIPIQFLTHLFVLVSSSPLWFLRPIRYFLSG